LTAYRTGVDVVDINALESAHAAYRPVLDECLGLDSVDLLPIELRNMLPSAYRQRSNQAKTTIFLKTHDCWCLTYQGEPVFPAEATRGVIHIVRDPRDVAVSAGHHWGVDVDTAIDYLNDHDHWIAQKPGNQQIPQLLSDWSTHTRSWIGSRMPSLLLRYEDMRHDPVSCFREVLCFVGWDVDEHRLLRAVNACAFERLQAQEQKEGFREKLASATAGFFRQGQSGGWRSVLSMEQAQRVVQCHGQVMRELGYQIAVP
jgi:hypothetical protein